MYPECKAGVKDKTHMRVNEGQGLDRLYAKQVEIQKIFKYNRTLEAFSDNDAIFT